MGSIPADPTITEVPLPAQYASIKTDGKRMVDTLHASCAWGNTPDGGMSKSSLSVM